MVYDNEFLGNFLGGLFQPFCMLWCLFRTFQRKFQWNKWDKPWQLVNQSFCLFYAYHTVFLYTPRALYLIITSFAPFCFRSLILSERCFCDAASLDFTDNCHYYYFDTKFVRIKRRQLSVYEYTFAFVCVPFSFMISKHFQHGAFVGC